MSTHRTLKKRKVKFRSVRKKWERLSKLQEEEKDKSVFEFPKEKIFRQKKIKKKEDEEKTVEELIEEKNETNTA